MADEKQVVLSRDLGAEILECQRSRSDLLKWKLILVAGVGAAALGLVPGQNKQPLLLALIPFVCVYVDLLCSHQWLQIHVLAAFLRRQLDTYERFLENQRKDANAFALEKWALYGSTILLCIGTGILAYVLLGASVEPKWKTPWIVSAVGVGLVLSFITTVYNESTLYEWLVERSEESRAFVLAKWAPYGVTMLVWLGTASLAAWKVCVGDNQGRILELRLILGAAAVGLVLSFLTMGYFYDRLNRVRAIA